MLELWNGEREFWEHDNYEKPLKIKSNNVIKSNQLHLKYAQNLIFCTILFILFYTVPFVWHNIV